MTSYKLLQQVLLLLLLLFLFLIPQVIKAQTATGVKDSDQLVSLTKQVNDMKVGDSHFMVTGLATFGFVNQKTTSTIGGLKTTSKYNSLGDANRYEFSPMFLWRHGDNLLLEFEPSFNGVNIGVNWAAISYFVAPGFIVRGGYLVLPFGLYSKHLAAGWINKLASDPIGVNPAGSDFGLELEGGLPLGDMKWGYDVAVSNGFQLNPDGTTQGVGINAISNNKTFSGRLSLLPLSNSSLEIGVSALYGTLATPVGLKYSYSSPRTSMYAVDLSYVKSIDPVLLNFKGQYSISKINNQNYINPVDTLKSYSFTNNTNATYGQLSIRPVQVENKILKNLEFAFRYVSYNTPVSSTWGQKYTEQDYGLDYWLTWRTVLKLTYEDINGHGTSSPTISGIQGSTNINRIVLQFSTEF